MIRDSINKFVSTCFKASYNAGWWTDLKTGENLCDPALMKKYRIVQEKIALIHSEVSEGLEGYRKDLFDDHLPHRKMIEVELADAMIRIGDLAGAMDLDLGGAVEEKLAYNANRADHKLENRAAEGGKAF
jgi:NTP pyrophosphatase (non-canonical NTP hydrolase)